MFRSRLIFAGATLYFAFIFVTFGVGVARDLAR